MLEAGTMPGLAHRHGRHISAVAAAAVALLPLIVPHTRALAEADVLQQAINYVFTGTLDPKNGPEIIDRKSCVVVLPDPENKRSIRYYLSRFRMDTARFEKIYAGRMPSYTLAVEGDDDVVEFLNPDMTVAHGHQTARIPLPGDIDQTQRALRLIADQCGAEKPKAPF
jgi:hypothetical protein